MPNESTTDKPPTIRLTEFFDASGVDQLDSIDTVASDLIERLRKPPYWLVLSTEQRPFDANLIHGLVSAITLYEDESGLQQVGEPSHISKTRIRVDAEQATRKGKVTRYSRSNDALPLHTDGSNKLLPPSLVAFAMERPDPKGGGASIMLSAVDLVQELPDDLVDQLRRPDFPFVGERRFPILEGDAQDIQIRYYRNQIDSAISPSSALPIEIEGALDQLDRHLASSQRSVTFSMAAGDVVLMDNRRVLHGREAMPADSPRLMHRFRSSANALQTRSTSA